MSTLEEDMLAHHGIKGMRWGVRRSRGPSGKVGSVEMHVTESGRVVKTTGGTGHPTSSDAVRAKGLHQIAKGSGTHALSNDQLQFLNSRLNLEQQYSKLSSATNKKITNAGAKVAKEILMNVGKQHLTKVLSEGLSSVTKK